MLRSGMTPFRAAGPRMLASLAPEAYSRRWFPELKLTTLSNGMQVATEHFPHGTATVGVYIRAGSRYESAADNGVAHFLEHIIFKGSKTRSRVQIEKDMENMGGRLNAYTGRDHTCYIVQCAPENVDQSMAMVADILQHSRLEQAAVQQERDVILQELESVYEDPFELVMDNLHQTAFQGSPLGRTILGPVENIESISADAIQKFFTKHYSPDRMLVVGAGPIDHDQFVKTTSGLFTDLPKSSGVIDVEPATFTGSDLLIRNDDDDTAHVAIAFPTTGINAPEAVPLMFAEAMLGSFSNDDPTSAASSHSNLIAAVNEAKCAKSVMTFNVPYEETGLFGVYATADQYSLNELAYNITNEITRLSYEVTDEQIETFRKQVLYKALAHTDCSHGSFEDIGRQILFHGRRITPAELEARILNVDAAAVRNAAMKLFNDTDIAVAAVGPIFELPDYTYLRRRTYWLRY